MSKYEPLTKYLQSTPQGQSITLSFGELNRILGFPVPKSASNHRPWWANHEANPQAAWLDAGFRVEAVNTKAGTVRFVRDSELKPKPASSGTAVLRAQSAPAAPYNVQRLDDCHLDLHELTRSISETVKVAGGELRQDSIEVIWRPAPHKNPSSLPKGKQAIYCFFLGAACLKVGKVGEGNHPRYGYHHYGTSSTSSLPKSILKGKARITPLLQKELLDQFAALDKAVIGDWVKTHTSRLDLLIPAEKGPHILSLMEGFLHVRFSPMFEGQES